jgi:DNA-binding response OmpR family regulator
MIIEDDPDTIQLLQVVLKTGGYEPIPALGGKAGLLQLAESPTDLILLDLMMDDVDGWTLLETLKQDPELSQIPVIILSVKNPLEDPRRIKSHAGMFDDYVVKPFNVRDLLSRVRRVLDGYSGALPDGMEDASDPGRERVEE